MRLLLIRHGETVDNVAGLYAGSRDSALTAHGVLQAQRLASHLARLIDVKHVFSSDLQRAVKTAQAVVDAQDRDTKLVQLAELREKDFGSNEGLKYGAGNTDEGVTREHDDAESVEAMTARIGRFLDRHLLPVLSSEVDAGASCVVVAHGILLRVLFRCLCAKLPRGAISVSSAARATGPVPLVPSWGNTGYLEATVSVASLPADSPEPAWSSIRLHVDHVNCVDHLTGLKKTRGGIGSAKFDEKQRSIASFFTAASKKRKLKDAA